MKPKFDRDQNVVEWSILAETDSARTINHVVRLLDREGILDAIAVQSTESNETIPLRQLVAGISFNAGYTYADYHAGDKVAERNLAELIAGESSPELRTTGSNHLAYSLAGGALILLGAGVLAVRRKSRPTGRHSAHSVHAHAPLPARKPAVVHSTANGSAHSAIAPAKQPEKSAHNGNGKTSQPKLRRRRIFDYQRYYADLMSQVSDRAQETIAPAPARKVERTPAPVQRMDSHSIAAAAQAGLIESQKRLIEEQQRLIREQAKLIEEKTRVIQEKNQVLDKQTELFGNNIF